MTTHVAAFTPANQPYQNYVPFLSVVRDDDGSFIVRVRSVDAGSPSEIAIPSDAMTTFLTELFANMTIQERNDFHHKLGSRV